MGSQADYCSITKYYPWKIGIGMQTVNVSQKITPSYALEIGKSAYLWAWPLVNLHNRLTLMKNVPEPGLIEGIIPAGPPNTIGMLHDYILPEERVVACPNQDVVYGFGSLSASDGPAVIQVPDFGDRFWVYQVVNQRTDSFVRLGKMYDTKPGHYLLAPSSWSGEVPQGITGVFRYDTETGVVVPRVFMNDTAADREAIIPALNQICMYPLSQFDGTMKTVDWKKAATFGNKTKENEKSQGETQWVDPNNFFDLLGTVLDEVPPLPGEEGLYSWYRTVLAAAKESTEIAAALKQAAIEANKVVDELFEFRNFGIPLDHYWTTQRCGAQFETDYLMRTAVAKSNIFVNTPNETTYFYQDLDAEGTRLDGANTYTVHFGANQLPPVRGFWSLTIYNQEHFFHPNELNRYSLGTKNKELVFNTDGSLTLILSTTKPTDPQLLANWLPIPKGPFTAYMRAYWPDQSVLNGEWSPPAVTRKK